MNIQLQSKDSVVHLSLCKTCCLARLHLTCFGEQSVRPGKVLIDSHNNEVLPTLVPWPITSRISFMLPHLIPKANSLSMLVAVLPDLRCCDFHLPHFPPLTYWLSFPSGCCPCLTPLILLCSLFTPSFGHLVFRSSSHSASQLSAILLSHFAGSH